jgi:endonuclease YncB( thermonuclease family)
MRYLILISALLLGFSAQAQVVEGHGTVNYVVDGDTMDIRVSEAQRQELLDAGYVAPKHVSERYKTFRVRLANTDTAESKHKDESRNTEAGAQSASYVTDQILRRNVTYSCYRQGDYGRSICSLDVQGLGDLGLHLIETGHSPYVTYFGRHPTMHREYQEAEQSFAGNNKEEKRGFRLSDHIKKGKVKGLAEKAKEAAESWW